MCGIAGFWSPGGLDESAIPVIGRMTTAIRHRGPDDAGCWSDSRVGIALGHRRLSVIETDILAETGAFIHSMPYAAGAYRRRTPLMHEIRREGIDL